MTGKKTFKKERFEERLLQEVNKYLRTSFSDSRLQFVSITKVEMTPDLSRAMIYWDTFDSSKRKDASSAVKSIQGRVRSLLAASLSSRTVPEISFVYDAQYEAQQSIEKILAEESKLGKGF